MNSIKYETIIVPNGLMVKLSNGNYKFTNAERLAELVFRDEYEAPIEITFFGTCPSCTSPLNDKDNFCACCGKRVRNGSN